MSWARVPAEQAAGQLAQQLVADLVAEGVVDVLEPVDVEEEHGDRRPVGPLQLGVDELVQVRPVGQLGEVVVAGLPGGRPARPAPGR